MTTKSQPPPSQVEIERQVRELLDYGEIDKLAGWLDVPYESLNKQLNPNNSTNKSDLYRAARVIWGLKQLDPEKAWKVINILTAAVFPNADALQLVSRIESDVARLKAKLVEGAGS